MPHLILEYSQAQASDERVERMLDAVHAAAAGTGLFDAHHIRVRAIPVVFYRTGGSRDHFIHAQLRIHAGRNEAQKKTLSEAVLAAIRDQAWPAHVVTVEVVDMDRATYAKYSK